MGFVRRYSTAIWLAVLAVVSATAIVGGRQPVPEPVENVVAAPAVPAPPPVEVLEGSFPRNGTLSTTLAGFDLSPAVIYEIGEAVRPVFDVRRFQPGRAFQVVRNMTGEFLAFEYVIDDESKLMVERVDDGFEARREQLPLETRIDTVAADVSTSLWNALAGKPRGDQLVMELESVFRAQVDFYRDIRPGDQIKFIIEGLYHEGEFVKYGEVQAAEFVNQGKPLQAYRFNDEYYDENGMSTRRSFLPAPLEFTRISGNFSSGRLHPILNTVRAHRGVDYAAPTGTAVMAASDGRITYAGPNGTFGNFVRIQHTGGVITEYAHLSRVLVNVGQRVKQEEIIGRVGMTGLATGPHLHYQLQQNGSYVNPRTARLDPPKPIDPSLRDAYMTSITGPRSLLASLAASDSVLMAEE